MKKKKLQELEWATAHFPMLGVRLYCDTRLGRQGWGAQQALRHGAQALCDTTNMAHDTADS